MWKNDMPAAKPQALKSGAQTKQDRRRSTDRETALTPKEPLTEAFPPQLTGDIARSTWREVVQLYSSLDARIVSLLDKGQIIDLCIAVEQLAQIDAMRTAAINNEARTQQALEKVMSKGSPIDPIVFLKLINAVNGASARVMKIDARADSKRKLILSMRQALMLTPRSRGGSAPTPKDPPADPSPMAKIIDG
jgi:hypothetical protein